MYHIIIVKLIALVLPPHGVGQPMADTKCHMKKCLEFEKNAISHMTFAGWPPLSAGHIQHV